MIIIMVLSKTKKAGDIMFCPNCGSKNPKDAAFCLRCGADLREASELVEDLPQARPAPARPVWPWIALGVVALAALVLVLVVLLGGKDEPAPAAPTADPGTIVVPPTTEPEAPSPSPTSQIIVISPTPAPATPTPTPTPAPTPSVPDLVRVFYKDVEKTEFTAAVGESVPLNAQAYPIESFTNASFTWSASDPSVLKLEPAAYGRTCTVTVLKKVSAPVTLTVSCSGKAAYVTVYTKDAAPTVPPAGKVDLNKDIQYRINIFLSNFSEQGFLNMQLNTAPDDQLMKFVWVYCKINHSDAISYEGAYETISLGTMNEYLNRFFGITRSPVNGASYMLDQWNSFDYHDGKFWFPAASGEAYNKFTVAYEMMSNGDGTYTVSFQVFEVGLEEYWNTPGVDNAYYHKSNDEISNYVLNGYLTPIKGGTAVVRDYTYNGRATYQLISYTVWDITY